MADLLTEFETQITAATPVIAGVFGAVIGLAFIFAVAALVVRRVRGTIK